MLSLARPVFGINHVISYGQSLSSGWEGAPALSLTPRLDCLMLGESVRPRHENAPVWQAVGEAELRPLTATVQNIETGALLSPAQAAAMPAEALLLGETVLEATLHFWRGRMGAADDRHLLLASACGVGGQSIEQLSKGAEPALFDRLGGCALQAKAAAARGGRDYGVVALLLLQGENNNWGLDGATADRAAYKSLMIRLHADMVAELATGVAGQTLPPALFTYQTGAAYAADAQAIPMAQLEASREVPGIFLAAPVYPVTDRGGHLDANGYRWLGQQFGKVMHAVLDLDSDWRPLSPLSARLVGSAVVVRFEVPVPPLAFGRPFAGRHAVDVPDQGFAVLDENGPVPIEAVVLDRPDGVAIALARPPIGNCTLRYADRTHHGGLGGLHDSDATVANDVFVGDEAGLGGRPYPLMNWCVAFAMPVRC